MKTAIACFALLLGGAAAARAQDAATFWNSATVYFLLTDRFENGNAANDLPVGRRRDGGLLRSYQGGDLAGLTRNIEEGYFDSLGVSAIWLTPFVEQIHAGVDEGTGKTYAFHGYWTRDWTAVDPNLGTLGELRAMVEAAHRRGIRVLMDAVLNHTGPPTPLDPAWPDDWVRTSPQCTYRDYTSTVTCTLVRTLPDIRTESDAPVELPPALVEKWRQEGRLDRERAELDDFFQRTRYPRAPRYYVIKWLTDWVRELGFDGYRVDTAKHIEESVSAALRREADHAFAEWKRTHPAHVIDDLPFYMMGEVYGYELGHGRQYDFGDRSVDFFQHGYDALLNFGFKREAAGSIDSVYTRYAEALAGPLRGASVLNYLSSHDDGSPFDRERADPIGAANRLLLAPGGAQIYYGDETARPLRVTGAEGDANLRSNMNWQDLERGGRTAEILSHWRKLGRFRKSHPAIGAGAHRQLQASPYVFSRVLEGDRADRVVVALDHGMAEKTIAVAGVFENGTELVDGYSGMRARVRRGSVTITTAFPTVLLGQPPAPSVVRGTPPVRIHVVNRSTIDMDIHASSRGMTYRMGIVFAGQTQQFTLRPAMLASGGQIELMAEVTGAGPRQDQTVARVRAGPLQLSPGNIVDFEIPTLITNSTATIRP